MGAIKAPIVASLHEEFFFETLSAFPAYFPVDFLLSIAAKSPKFQI